MDGKEIEREEGRKEGRKEGENQMMEDRKGQSNERKEIEWKKG